MPPFAGMHDAAAAVAGGSIAAMEAILGGDVEHAHHPGGGLHHAMAGRASGFCIYDDPALAIARARADGLRVLYIDLDVHHGDGVEAIHAADPGVLTCSIHETGRTLFPGTGYMEDVGEGTAAGTSVNIPLPAGTGEGPWLDALTTLLPELAATFGPDVVVSQHGADSHAWDPLAHLAITTTAHGSAARLVDRLAHRFAGGRWLATGGGGYDVYRVVPRTWALTWLAGAHREVPAAIPTAWRERWASEAARYGQAPLPETFEDVPDAGAVLDPGTQARARAVAAEVRAALVPRLVREATDRGWWDPADPAAPTAPDRAAPPDPSATPTIVAAVDRATWAGLTLAPRVVAPFDPSLAQAIVGARHRGGRGRRGRCHRFDRRRAGRRPSRATSWRSGSRRRGVVAGSRPRCSTASPTPASSGWRSSGPSPSATSSSHSTSPIAGPSPTASWPARARELPRDRVARRAPGSAAGAAPPCRGPRRRAPARCHRPRRVRHLRGPRALGAGDPRRDHRRACPGPRLPRRPRARPRVLPTARRRADRGRPARRRDPRLIDPVRRHAPAPSRDDPRRAGSPRKGSTVTSARRPAVGRRAASASRVRRPSRRRSAGSSIEPRTRPGAA